MTKPWRYAVAAAAALALSSCGAAQHASSVSHGRAGSSPISSAGPVSTSTASLSPVAVGADRPALLVAKTTDGRIVELNPATGAVTRMLYRGEKESQSTWMNWDPEAAGGLVVSPDGSTLYFEGPLTFNSDNTPSVPIDRLSLRAPGARPSVVASGFLPALSPDGSELAYGIYLPGAKDGPSQILVRNLASGSSRVVAGPPPGDDSIQVTGLSWAPDNRHLALSLFTPGCRTTAVSVIDTAGKTTLQPPSGPTFLGAPTDDLWEEPTYTPDGGLLLQEEAYPSDCQDSPATRSLVTVAPGSAHVTRVVASGREGTLGGIAVDSTGRHVLFIQETAQGPRLMVSDNGGAPNVLAPNITYATW